MATGRRSRDASEGSGWIGEGLRQRHWSNADLARATGLNPNTITDVRSGKAVRPSTLKLIRAAFDADLTGTGLAVGATAAQGAVATMVHEDALFGQIYLAYTMMTLTQRRRFANYGKRLALGRRASQGAPLEDDTSG